MIFSVILFDQNCVVQVMFLVLYFILDIFLSILLKEIILNLKRLETNKQKKSADTRGSSTGIGIVTFLVKKTKQDKTRQDSYVNFLTLSTPGGGSTLSSLSNKEPSTLGTAWSGSRAFILDYQFVKIPEKKH